MIYTNGFLSINRFSEITFVLISSHLASFVHRIGYRILIRLTSCFRGINAPVVRPAYRVGSKSWHQGQSFQPNGSH